MLKGGLGGAFAGLFHVEQFERAELRGGMFHVEQLGGTSLRGKYVPRGTLVG